MKTLNSYSLNTEPLLDNESNSKTVYFHQIDDIHINKFKSYTDLLQGQLKEQWIITDDIQEALVIVSNNEGMDSTKDFYLTYFVANDMANIGIKEPIATGFDMTADNILNVLNQTSNNTKAPVDKKTEQKTQTTPPKMEVFKAKDVPTIKKTEPLAPIQERHFFLLGHQTSTVQTVSEQLVIHDDTDQNIKFHPIAVGSSLPQIKTEAEQVLVVIDLNSEEAVMAYETIKPELEKLGISDKKITVILTGMNDVSEDVFDLIYDQCDDNTQVTVLDYMNTSEMKFFTEFLIK